MLALILTVLLFGPCIITFFSARQPKEGLGCLALPLLGTVFCYWRFLPDIDAGPFPSNWGFLTLFMVILTFSVLVGGVLGCLVRPGVQLSNLESV